MMEDLAATVDGQVMCNFAGINGTSEEELEQRSEQLALPIAEGGMGLERLQSATKHACNTHCLGGFRRAWKVRENKWTKR